MSEKAIISKSVNSLERISILFENESCEELEALDVEEVEAGPGLGCTSPDTNRSTKNQAEKVTIAPVSKQSLINFMFYMMLYRGTTPIGNFLVIT